MRHYKPNPYGLFPRGNRPANEDEQSRFGTLDVVTTKLDETGSLDLLLELLSWCSLDTVCRLSATSTAWYIFIHTSDYWKRSYAQHHPDQTIFVHDWKSSTIAAIHPGFRHEPVLCTHALYHDTLFQSWLCTLLPCDHKLLRTGVLVPSTDTHRKRNHESGDIDGGAHAPAALHGAADAENQPPTRYLYKSKFKEIPKREGSSLSVETFRKEFEEAGVPVIIKGVATKWKIFEALGGELSRLATARVFRDSSIPLRCEHTTMTASAYVQYAQQQQDERPIYLFDAEFTAALNEGLYDVPSYFSCDDYFHVLGDQRPKYRWLIAGPKRGGSSFHVDPNYTHAWNACLTGRKRWLLFPPHCPPAGVFPSSDMRNVTTPVSLTEWLLNYYTATTTTLAHSGYEGICEAGEVMYIPAGWWHFVINLEDSVAITQNYVSRTNLSRVIRFLQGMKASISGVDEDNDAVSAEEVQQRRDTLGSRFVEAMRSHFPSELQKAEDEIEASRRRKRPREPKLELLSTESEGFSFSF
jgi:hypothetical protein